jgi:peptide/nickel transport system ATP-binding protein
VPSLLNPPPGCRFAERCAHRATLDTASQRRCREHDPALQPDANGWVACHFPLNSAARP